MSLFELFGLVIALIAALGYINHRFIRLPETIGITVVAMAMSVGITGYGFLNPEGARWAADALAGIKFSEVVFHGLLGLLLFAGSVTLEIKALAREKGTILVLATAGVLISTVVVGVAVHFVTQFFGYEMLFLHSLLLGAVISPTDPVAVIGILRRAGMTRRMEMQVAGESLFNDATGVVAVLTVLALITGANDPDAGDVLVLLARQALGGMGLGLLLGGAALLLLRGAATSHTVCIMTTLAVATGGYALGEHLGVSALIAVIVAGLLVGNLGRTHAMKPETQRHVFEFWELIDQLLNLVLFGLIGIQLIALQPSMQQFLLSAAVVPVALFARWASVALPMVVMARFRPYDPHTIVLLTWGGLRGGLSVALALSLPASIDKPFILSATYAVVIFSILVQALTLEKLVSVLGKRGGGRAGTASPPAAGDPYAAAEARPRAVSTPPDSR